MNCKIQILLLVVITVFCAPPPKVPPYFKITAAKPTLKGVKKNSPNLRKMEGGDANAIFNYTEATINITKDSNIEHYYSVISTINVPDGAFFPEFLFSTSKEKGIHLNMTSFECKVIDATTKKEFTDKNCTPEFTESSSDYVFKCKCGFGNNEQLIFNYTYIITRDEKDILFRQEPVYISSLYSGGDCFYRFVIPEDYKNLGLRYNNFQKESSCSYIYNGSCPKDNLIDVIKFSPRLTHWKNSMSQSIESTSNFRNDLNLTFLRMYKQGRNRNKNYKLTTFDGEELNDSAIITDYVYQKVALKANGKNRVGVNLTTAYSNNLDDEFILEVPDEFYDNIQDIDQEIKDKADEVLRNASYYSGYPDYYRLGKFVYEYMTINNSRVGENLTALQVLHLRNGVCEHYNILYKTMLNYKGYKTFSNIGYGLEGNYTEVNETIIGHEWAGVIVNGIPTPIDVTWDLVEGISSAHVLKGFKQEISTINGAERRVNVKHKVQLVDNLDDEVENFTYVEKDLRYNKTKNEIQEMCSIYNVTEENSTVIETTAPVSVPVIVAPSTSPRTVTNIPFTQGTTAPATTVPSGYSGNTHTPNENRFILPLYFNKGISLNIRKLSICFYIISLLFLL